MLATMVLLIGRDEAPVIHYYPGWKDRQIFGANNSPTPSSHEEKQVYYKSIFGMNGG